MQFQYQTDAPINDRVQLDDNDRALIAKIVAKFNERIPDYAKHPDQVERVVSNAAGDARSAKRASFNWQITFELETLKALGMRE